MLKSKLQLYWNILQSLELYILLETYLFLWETNNQRILKIINHNIFLHKLKDKIVDNLISVSFVEFGSGRQIFSFGYICISLVTGADAAPGGVIEQVGFTGWVVGFSVQSVSWPCWPLSGPIENPSGCKDLLSALFSLAKTLPKHATPLPHTQNTSPNEGLTEQLGVSSHFYLFSSSFAFGCVPDPSVIWIPATIGWRLAVALSGPSCCQAPRRICCGCDSSTAGLESVFSLSQIGGMFTDFHTRPVGPAIHLSRQWNERCRPTHFLQNVPPIWTFVVQSLFHVQQSFLEFLKCQYDIFL